MTQARVRLPVGKLDMALLAELLEGEAPPADVLVGPGVGRDVAVVDVGGDRYWLLKSDPVTFATDEIAHYAVTVNVNDVACAGGTPRWLLATFLLPADGEGVSEGEVRALFRSLREACRSAGIALVGGHTEVTHGLDRPIVVAALVGEVARDALVRSDGMREGDVVLCTKGVPLEGCALLARERRAALLATGVPATTLDRCAAFLHRPGIGVLEDARAACGAATVHAMHDPTEGGLATALHELAVASGLGLRVNGDALPVLPEAQVLCAPFGIDPLGLIASGALLAAVAPADVEGVVAACRSRGIPCTPIAVAVSAAQGLTLIADGREAPLPRFDQDELGKAFAGE